MSGVIVDTSVWIDFFSGRPVPELEDALRGGGLAVLAPIVTAELIRTRRPRDGVAMRSLLEALPLHPTPLPHWIRVAQCALERDAVLLSRDEVFRQVARFCALRLLTPLPAPG